MDKRKVLINFINLESYAYISSDNIFEMEIKILFHTLPQFAFSLIISIGG